MKGSPYRDRDYQFGQMLLTLRIRLGLTQASLAGILGVSRRSVGDWEAGNNYPNVNHLEQLIALAIERQAFQDGHEAEEAHYIWQMAGLKVLLDEKWLHSLLAKKPSIVEDSPVPLEAGGSPRDDYHQLPATGGPRLDCAGALAVPAFYGREWELDLLAKWVIEEYCRVVCVLGIGGIGKSSLAISLMHRLAERFEVVIWRSLRDLSGFEELLDGCLQVLIPESMSDKPAGPQKHLYDLLKQMRKIRVFMVLDGVEAVMMEGEGTGRMRPGFDGLGSFLRMSSETEHQSCVFLTSREKPSVLIPFEGSQEPVKALRLARLDTNSCKKLLAEKNIKGSLAVQERLVDIYAGNPMALKIVAQTIIDLFDGEIAPFLEQGEIIFDGIRDLLGEQFARLSSIEQDVLLWMAILGEPTTLDDLSEGMVNAASRSRLFEAVGALRNRSLIEPGKRQGSFSLHSIMLEYLSAQPISYPGSLDR